MSTRGWTVLPVLVLLVGCATAPKITEVGTVRAEPDAHRNKLIEVLGKVIEYEPPRGDVVRTWAFTLEDVNGQRLDVYTDTRDAEDIAAADRLVLDARANGDAIWVTGYLRVGKYRSVTAGPRLDLRRVRYGDRAVELEYRGDPYYDDPRFHFGLGYYHGYHYPYYWHHPHYYW